MADRLDLQTILLGLLDSDNVYFQPPSTISMSYPCIVYNRNNAKTDFADNEAYKNKKRYQVIVIDQNPDSKIPDKVAALPMCTFNRFYAVDNLNHDVFYLFF